MSRDLQVGIRVDLFIHSDDPQSPKLDQILHLLQQVITKEQSIMATLDDVLTDVQAESTVGDSLVALTTAIKTQLDAVLAGGLPAAQQAKVDAIFAGIEANKQKWADAVTANTPAA